MADYEAAAGETHGWEQRYKALVLVRPRTVAEEVKKPPPPDETFTVSPRAAAALKNTLDQLDHEPNQILRLNLDSTSKVSIALDVEREGDHMIKSGDTPALLIDPHTRDSVQAKTLDVRESENGTQIVLTG